MKETKWKRHLKQKHRSLHTDLTPLLDLECNNKRAFPFQCGCGHIFHPSKGAGNHFGKIAHVDQRCADSIKRFRDFSKLCDQAALLDGTKQIAWVGLCMADKAKPPLDFPAPPGLPSPASLLISSALVDGSSSLGANPNSSSAEQPIANPVSFRSNVETRATGVAPAFRQLFEDSSSDSELPSIHHTVAPRRGKRRKRNSPQPAARITRSQTLAAQTASSSSSDPCSPILTSPVSLAADSSTASTPVTPSSPAMVFSALTSQVSQPNPVLPPLPANPVPPVNPLEAMFGHIPCRPRGRPRRNPPAAPAVVQANPPAAPSVVQANPPATPAVVQANLSGPHPLAVYKLAYDRETSYTERVRLLDQYFRGIPFPLAPADPNDAFYLELRDLIASFGRHALYTTHYQVHQRLSCAVYGHHCISPGKDSRTADPASVALQLLPGMVRMAQRYQVILMLKDLWARRMDNLPMIII